MFNAVVVIILLVLAFKFWPWVLGIAVLLIAIKIAVRIYAPSGKTIRSMRDAWDVLKWMKPAPWSKANKMSAKQRAGCFFFPGCDDLSIIKQVKPFILESLRGDASGQRCKFGQVIGSQQYSDAFNEAVNFYHWLLCGVFHKLQDRGAFDPEELSFCKSFNEKFCSPKHVIDSFALDMPKELALDDDTVAVFKKRH